MKKILLCSLSLLALSCVKKDEKKIGKWVVTKTQMGCKCFVQEATDRPIGEGFLGPFPTKQIAITEMCRNVDPTMEDPDKCHETHPACK